MSNPDNANKILVTIVTPLGPRTSARILQAAQERSGQPHSFDCIDSIPDGATFICRYDDGGQAKRFAELLNLELDAIARERPGLVRSWAVRLQLAGEPQECLLSPSRRRSRRRLRRLPRAGVIRRTSARRSAVEVPAPKWRRRVLQSLFGLLGILGLVGCGVGLNTLAVTPSEGMAHRGTGTPGKLAVSGIRPRSAASTLPRSESVALPTPATRWFQIAVQPIGSSVLVRKDPRPNGEISACLSEPYPNLTAFASVTEGGRLYLIGEQRGWLHIEWQVGNDHPRKRASGWVWAGEVLEPNHDPLTVTSDIRIDGVQLRTGDRVIAQYDPKDQLRTVRLQDGRLVEIDERYLRDPRLDLFPRASTVDPAPDQGPPRSETL